MASPQVIDIPDQEPPPRDRLSILPDEHLLQVFSNFVKFSHCLNLIKTSRRFYNSFLPELYKQTDRIHGWYPLYAAARTGNVATLERCHEFSAPLDSDVIFNKCEHFPLSFRPLILAIRDFKPDAVEWLLAHGADPSDTEIIQINHEVLRVYSPLRIARELPEKIFTPEERQKEYELEKRCGGRLPWLRLFKKVWEYDEEDRVAWKREIIAALERAGSREYPFHLFRNDW